jgi:hypothetical protein
MTSRRADETKLCIAFAEHCEIYFPRQPNVLNYTHIANEGRSPKDGAKLKKMGVKAGWFDYVFIWRGLDYPRIGFLEAKIGKNTLSDSQKGFDVTMRPMGVLLDIFRTVEQGHNILLSWGIKPIKPCQYFKEPKLATWDDKIAAMQNLHAPRKDKP